MAPDGRINLRSSQRRRRSCGRPFSACGRG